MTPFLVPAVTRSSSARRACAPAYKLISAVVSIAEFVFKQIPPAAR
jgi:hypothetical protein